MTGVYTLPKEVLMRLVAMLEQFEGSTVDYDPLNVDIGDDYGPAATRLFINKSTETIPPFACMKITASNEDEGGNEVAEVIKPDSTGGPFMFNGEFEIEVGEQADGFTGEVIAFCDTATPATGETWGPKSDWKIESDGDPAVLVWGKSGILTISGRTVTASASALFLVQLEHVGGQDGSATEQCSWRYNIKKVGNDEILEADINIGLDPHKYRRINLGKYEKATHGIACILAGNLSVITSNETPIAGTC